MVFLTAGQVLFIHARLIAETGGEHGVLDIGLLESAIYRPQSTFDGVDLYPTLFLKAAALLESLIGNHAFLDGNKRTAITAASIFLRRNGFQLSANNHQLEQFTLACALRQYSLSQISDWLESHSLTV